MPTFKHSPTGKRFFFAHIPRTAGRFIISNIMFKNQCDWDDLHLGEDKMYNLYEGMEIGHFHKNYYEKYLKVKGIPHFSIVRNPITRFKSASIYLKRYIGENIEKDMEDPKIFSSTIKALGWHHSEAANWFRPQIDFMNNETKIWKFEYGFEKKFATWISSIVGVDLIFDRKVEYPMQKDESNKFILTSNHIDNIRNYYKDDFTEFYPDQ